MDKTVNKYLEKIAGKLGAMEKSWIRGHTADPLEFHPHPKLGNPKKTKEQYERAAKSRLELSKDYRRQYKEKGTYSPRMEAVKERIMSSKFSTFAKNRK